ncbi:hypothetical protein B0H16DRAFT_1504279 [Mycena metata]|uniref:F-box domain-containing protein n=1 Tax=Mycena metata TaxID=1033252 RepID=A0AAD7K2T4_9AGAR|nr:hypothetical protein B0H16DRAFT_1504279 [Mycena metata]
MSETSFSRLSMAHIRYIFQFLEDSELYNISFTCLRLHEPALLVLLSRRNIPDPLEKVDIRLGEIDNTLQALRVALFLPSIKRISVSFSPGVILGTWGPFPPLTIDQLQSTTVRLVDEINRLQRLLQRLQTVGDITLVLPGSLEWNIRDVNLERGDTPDLFSWSPLITLLQETVQKHCSSLKVAASPFWTHAVTRPRAPKGRLVPHLVRKVLKRTRDTDMSALARWEGIKYRPHSIPPTILLQPRSCLTHFSIQTTLLLFPGIAGWTFSALKHSPIASLHISGLNIFKLDWGPIASKIADAVPDLVELDFDDEEIEPDCLMWMLNRLSRLSSLKIGPRMSVYLTYPRIFPPFSSWYLPAFRSLTKLSAPAPYVSLFLMRPHPLPALTSLEIPPVNIWQVATHHHTLLHLHLPKILRRLRDINHVLHPLPVTISSEWRGNETSFLLARHIDTSLALDPEKSNALCEITHLVLEDFNSTLHPQCSCFYHWLKLFPSLQQISWQGTSNNRQATDPGISRLAREISRSSPTVKNLVVHGTHYSISGVLASADGREPGLACAMSSTLVDLPPEVLLSIFEFLNAELLSLSVLCRRLHFLALPLFLERHSIPAPSEETVVKFDAFCSPDDDVLRALTIALFVPSIDHLSCVFPDPSYIFRHLETIRRVTRLVKRLERVGKLSLEFYPNRFRLDTFIPKFYSETRVWELCYDALCDLLLATSDKSCTSLSVIGCPAPDSSPVIFSPSRSASIRVDSITDLHLAVDHFPTAYSWWMFLALKDSPISSLKLHITDDTDLDAVDFAATLRTLSFRGGHVARSTIFQFLRRHPRISNLTLPNRPSRDNPSTSTIDVGRGLRLDDLVVLRAPLAYILHFLQTCDPFPALQRITIVLDDLENPNWDLTSIIEHIHETYLSPPTIAIEIGVPLDVNFLTSSVGHVSVMGGKWTHATRHIVALAVESDWDWFGTAPGNTGLDAGVVQVVSNWFASFKGLQRISIEGPMPSEPDTLVGFTESLRRQLPALEAIHFNQHTLFERQDVSQRDPPDSGA